MTNDTFQRPSCPKCSKSMRMESKPVQVAPKPKIFWYCVNPTCIHGSDNAVIHGG